MTASEDDGSLVFVVDSVMVSLQKSNPPNLLVSALGKVRTSGWKNARLTTRIKGISPEGFMEFDFKADPPGPGEMVLQAILPVTAERIILGVVAPELRGVKVFAESNTEVKLL